MNKDKEDKFFNLIDAMNNPNSEYESLLLPQEIQNEIDFEQFLQEKFNNQLEYQGIPITKDNCYDLFDRWSEDLDVQELIDYSNEFATSIATLASTKTKEEIINNFPFDDRPTYGGLINFASNGVKDDITGFEYGFRLGWQTCWYELKDLLTKLK